MSENVDLVRSVCDAWQRGEFGELTWADAEIELVFADGPQPAASRGLRSMLQAWNGAAAAWAGLRVPVDGLTEIDSERVLVRFRSSGEGGRDEAAIFSIRDGRVVRLAVYRDRDRAYAELGVEHQAMSLKNVEVVQRVYRELNNRLALPPELFDAACVTDLSAVSLDVPVLHGFDASQRALGSYFQTFDGFHVAADVLHADDRRVVAAIRDGGRIRGSGAEIWNHYFHVWTLRDGVIVRLSSRTDRQEAFRAVGLED